MACSTCYPFNFNPCLDSIAFNFPLDAETPYSVIISDSFNSYSQDIETDVDGNFELDLTNEVYPDGFFGLPGKSYTLAITDAYGLTVAFSVDDETYSCIELNSVLGSAANTFPAPGTTVTIPTSLNDCDDTFYCDEHGLHVETLKNGHEDDNIFKIVVANDTTGLMKKSSYSIQDLLDAINAGVGGGGNTYNNIYNLFIETTDSAYWTPEMFGATGIDDTIENQGTNQTEADALFGAGFCDVTTDTFDWAAIQFMCNLALSSEIKLCIFRSKTYYLNQAVELPHKPADNKLHRYTFLGNGCYIINAYSEANQEFPFFYSSATNFTDALSVQSQRAFTFDGFMFKGRPGSSGTSYGLQLEGGGTFNVIRNCFFQTMDYGLKLGFMINNIVENCFGFACDIHFEAGTDQSLGQPSYAVQSNLTTFRLCKVSGGGDIGIFINLSNNCRMEDCTEEDGFTTAAFHVYGAGGVMNTFYATNTHAEHNSTSDTFYLYLNAGQRAIIDGIEDQSAGGNLVLCETPDTMYVTVKNVPYLQAASKFGHKGADSMACVWQVENIKARNSTMRDDSNWTIGGGFAKPRLAAREEVNGNPLVLCEQNSMPGNSVVGTNAPRLFERCGMIQLDSLGSIV